MPTAPYPNLETIANYVRDIVNDAIIPGGQTFKDNQAFTVDYMNMGYIDIQQFLVSQGYVTLIDSLILSGLPAVSTLDPGQFVSLSWTGYNPGTGLQAIVLPQNLIRPLKLWERPSAIPPAAAAVFNPMDLILNGMDAVPKEDWNQQWEWRSDTIWMPGAKKNTDLRIRFLKYFPAFTSAAFTGQIVPILRCETALAGFIAYRFCKGRGDVDADTILSKAQSDAMMIDSLDSLEGREMPKNSERGKMKDRYHGGEGGAS